jgi:hypothetical protein
MHTIACAGAALTAAVSPARYAPLPGGDAAHQNDAYSATRIAITPIAPALNVLLVA